MNLKKSISLMLASTAISTAFSGVPTGVGTGVSGLIDIVPIQHGDAVVIEFRAQGQGMVDGIIRIQSNSSALPLTIRFHCQVN